MTGDDALELVANSDGCTHIEPGPRRVRHDASAVSARNLNGAFVHTILIARIKTVDLDIECPAVTRRRGKPRRTAAENTTHRRRAIVGGRFVRVVGPDDVPVVLAAREADSVHVDDAADSAESRPDRCGSGTLDRQVAMILAIDKVARTTHLIDIELRCRCGSEHRMADRRQAPAIESAGGRSRLRDGHIAIVDTPLQSPAILSDKRPEDQRAGYGHLRIGGVGAIPDHAQVDFGDNGVACRGRIGHSGERPVEIQIPDDPLFTNRRKERPHVRPGRHRLAISLKRPFERSVGIGEILRNSKIRHQIDGLTFKSFSRSDLLGKELPIRDTEDIVR